jgi:hypothetical protein
MARDEASEELGAAASVNASLLVVLEGRPRQVEVVLVDPGHDDCRQAQRGRYNPAHQPTQLARRVRQPQPEPQGEHRVPNAERGQAADDPPGRVHGALDQPLLVLVELLARRDLPVPLLVVAAEDPVVVQVVDVDAQRPVGGHHRHKEARSQQVQERFAQHRQWGADEVAAAGQHATDARAAQDELAKAPSLRPSSQKSR